MRHRITALRHAAARWWAGYLADVRTSEADWRSGWTDREHVDEQSAP